MSKNKAQETGFGWRSTAEQTEFVTEKLPLTMATVKNCTTKGRAFLFYPGGKGPLLMGVILGVVVARAAEADAPGFGPLAVCEEPAVVAPAPESSC